MDGRITKAVAGDADALSSLLVEYHDALLVHIEAKMSPQLRGSLQADDLLQETFVAAFQGIRGFRPQSDSAFGNWLRTIAEHRLLDAARARQAQKRGGEFQQRQPPADASGSLLNLFDLIDADLSTASVKVSREEGVQELKRQIAALPENYRQAIELKYLQELSVEETAQAMGCTVTEVRGVIYRARLKLTEFMGGSSLYLLRP